MGVHNTPRLQICVVVILWFDVIKRALRGARRGGRVGAPQDLVEGREVQAAVLAHRRDPREVQTVYLRSRPALNVPASARGRARAAYKVDVLVAAGGNDGGPRLGQPSPRILDVIELRLAQQ